MAVDRERFTATGPGYTVRPLRPEDIPWVREHIFRVITEDLGYGYNPAWHWDIDDLQGVYLDDPRHALWVAIDDASGALVATGGIRKGGPRSAPEQWVIERYDQERTAQVVRVYVAREHRRRGIARTIVELARRFAAAEGGYDVICLHTDTRAPGAEGFWRSMPTTLIYDARGIDPFGETLHFELSFPEDSQQEGAAAVP
jgi:GNAT superfamily N-acetyltransferase